MGHPTIETPNLDQLAKQSVVFRRGYVPTALCRPALMTLATGLYSHQNKTTGNDPARTAANAKHAAEKDQHINELLISHIDETGALPKWLSKRGYVSHQSGKWWEGSYQRGGFTHGMTHGFPNPRGRRARVSKIGRTGMQPVLDFIDQSIADNKPFLSGAHSCRTLRTHHPLDFWTSTLQKVFRRGLQNTMQCVSGSMKPAGHLSTISMIRV